MVTAVREWRFVRRGSVVWRSLVLASLAGTVIALVAVPALGAASSQRRAGITHIYWTEPENGRYYFHGPGINTIWRADINGSHVVRDFIKVPQYPGGVALGGSYIYWTEDMAAATGRAKIDGSQVRQRFTGANGTALAVTAHYIYLITTNKVWRLDLDGSHPRALFSVGGSTYFGGIAVDRSHIYWSARDQGTIGRADINGTHVDSHFITGLQSPNGLALSSRNLYWASTNPSYSSSIGRASLNGTHVDQNFIPGLSYPFAVVAAGGRLYWADYDSGTIGRADLNGMHVQKNFIDASVPHDKASPMYLAVGR